MRVFNNMYFTDEFEHFADSFLVTLSSSHFIVNKTKELSGLLKIIQQSHRVLVQKRPKFSILACWRLLKLLMFEL